MKAFENLVMVFQSALRKYTFAFLFGMMILISGSSFSQKPFQFIWPIDSPFVITGNYGELRPNHFHAGIDFSTSGKINLPVYSVEEGYISRIRISPYGYGKCVYITHPGGKVTVYAHLNSFSLKVDKVAKAFCLATQNNEIDYMPPPRSVYVRKNEIIGLSGNTGGSTGPHLHFEIRDELTEVPLNPLGFYRISDRTPPDLNAVALYNLTDTLLPVFLDLLRVKESKRDSLILSEDHLTVDAAVIGIAFSGADRVYPNGNPNNIFSARIFLDDTLIYSHQLNNIAFSETRFVNEFCETISRAKFQKCFLPTVYPQEMILKSRDKGLLFLSDRSFRKVRIELADESGNSRILQFFLKAKKIRPVSSPGWKSDSAVLCDRYSVIIKDGLEIDIPPRSLYRSVPLFVNSSLQSDGRFSIFPDVNLRQPVIVSCKTPPFLAMLDTKLVLKGASTVIPEHRHDSLFFNIKSFGKYYLAIDTTAPKIRVNYSAKKLQEAWQMDAFSFEVSDHSSGIGKYNLWLNNAWVLTEYDAKTNLLTYYFDEDTPIGLLQFKLEVEDKVGNKAFLEYTLKK